MNNITTRILLPFIALICSAFFLQAQSIAGTWKGTLEVQGTELDVFFNIEEEDGAWKGTLDVPGQGAKGIALNDISYEPPMVKVGIRAIAGSFEGKHVEANKLEGEWKQGNFVSELVMEKSEKAPEVKRPQTPKGPFPYAIKELMIPNKKADLELGATLTLPEGNGPFPTAILISGSGPQDRDESLMNHQPFWVIADYFSRNGIAVLRFDDRGVGESTGNFSKATSEDFASDVHAIFKFLRKYPGVDPAKIGFVGHSEGGLIGPMVAAKQKKTAFVVMLAGPGITGKEIISTQTRAGGLAAGVDPGLVEANVKLSNLFMDIAIAEPNRSEAHEKMKTAFEDYTKTVDEEYKEEFEIPESVLNQQISMMLSNWFRYFLAYDPVPALKKVRSPVLAVNGSKDVQVLPQENLEGIEAALKAGKTSSYDIKEFPELNHLFQHSKTGSPSEYVNIAETFSPEVLEYVANWIQKTVK